MASTTWSRSLSWLMAALIAVDFAARLPCEEAEPAASVISSPGPARVANSSLGDLLRRIEPWVVAIQVDRKGDLERPSSRLAPQIPEKLMPPETRDYFKRPPGYVTGLLVDREGHVLTSYYNVAGELRSIEVSLPDGTRRSAKRLAVAPVDDVALLGLEGEKPVVPAASWAEPPWAGESPEAGRIVLAIGRSPDPARLTLTQGVVSAAGRNGGRAFQTDAKLNYGNVGGPLLDLDGRIVGLAGFVGHIYPQWGLNSGIGFGVSVTTIQEILPTLKSGEDVKPPEYPFLGVRAGPNDIEVDGAPILQVLDSSAAARAGIEDGDVIVELGGARVHTFQQLRKLLYERRPGEKVMIEVRRDDETLEFEVQLGSREQ